jgi:type II secretory ATPase GspE/PulE/Tfp pilus assembly ATPase PilB-like protein
MVNFNDESYNNRVDELRRGEEEKLIQALAPQYGFDYINLRGYTINPEAVILIPENKAREASLVAFDYNHNTISIATRTPNHPTTQKILSEIQNDRQSIVLYMCSNNSLEHAWKRYSDIVDTKARKKGVFDIDTEEISQLAKQIKSKDDVIDKIKNIATQNNIRRVTDTIEIMFAGAIALNASDIHIEPEEKVVRSRYRLDGVLHDLYDIDRYIYERLISRFKLLAGMTLNKHAIAQDGRFTFVVSDREIEIRVSVIPGASGESLVMRLLDPSVASFKMENVELNPILKSIVETELKKPNGLILTTGPTGSGKTTALYTFLKEVHKEGVKIITIENPVEYKLEGIVQTQTSEHYSFSSGLRALLRQDPDVMLIGEIRDQEVASTAIHAAQTGHLVFSTLHTNSAVGGFPRLLDLGVDARILGSALNLMMGQRLLRRLCNNCKVAYQATEEEIAIIKPIIDKYPNYPEINLPLTIHKAHGCKECGGSGFKGRIGIFEAILMDDAVEEVLITDPRETKILEAAEPQGIPTMQEDGMDKVIRGITSLEELERVVELPKSTKANIKTADDVKFEDDEFLSHIVT